jgi:hypothetical protein
MRRVTSGASKLLPSEFAYFLRIMSRTSSTRSSSRIWTRVAEALGRLTQILRCSMAALEAGGGAPECSMAVGGPGEVEVEAEGESGPSRLVVTWASVLLTTDGRRAVVGEGVAAVVVLGVSAVLAVELVVAVVVVVAGTDEGVEESESGRARRVSSAGGTPGWTGVGASSVTCGHTMGTSPDALLCGVPCGVLCGVLPSASFGSDTLLRSGLLSAGGGAWPCRSLPADEAIERARVEASLFRRENLDRAFCSRDLMLLMPATSPRRPACSRGERFAVVVD